MSSSTAKRVLLYRFGRQPVEGIVMPGAYLQEDHLEMITVDGNLQKILYMDAKALCFASESGAADLFTEHPLFERRPKVAGLWTRFTFRDGDRLDGILSHNLLEWPTSGYMITPPRSAAHRQRVFVPRAALVGTELRGVVGRSRIAGTERREVADEERQKQLTMFDS